METANIVIIGAGVVGLAIAASLSEKNEGVYVFEKNRRHGLEASTRNSGVIHSGIHYQKGSLKAKMCIQGNALIYELCEKYRIPCKRLGKLAVANGEEEIKQLEQLLKKGRDNGVEGLRLVERNEVKQMEPNIVAERAIYAPTSGIIEQDELMNLFLARIRNNNGVIATDTEVTNIEMADKGYMVEGKSIGKPFSILSRTVINCAGLDSNKIASMLGLDVDKLGYRLSYYKGDYFRVIGKPPVKMLVYPVPMGSFLGIHLTPDLAGSVRLGPNKYPVDKIDYRVESNPDEFREGVKRFLPSILMRDIQIDSSGIRPELQSPKGSFRDFVIRHETDIGFQGFVNLIGIDSPGLTASPAIGNFVSELYEDEIKN